jgi:eukaryotic-like serine/threonine-protein kinase
MVAELDAQLIEWSTSVPAQEIAAFLEVLQGNFGAPLSAIGTGSFPRTGDRAVSPAELAKNTADTVMSASREHPVPVDPQRSVNTVIGEMPAALGGSTVIRPTPSAPASRKAAVAHPAGGTVIKSRDTEAPTTSPDLDGSDQLASPRSRAPLIALGALVGLGLVGLGAHFVMGSDPIATPTPPTPMHSPLEVAGAPHLAAPPPPEPIAPPLPGAPPQAAPQPAPTPQAEAKAVSIPAPVPVAEPAKPEPAKPEPAPAHRRAQKDRRPTPKPAPELASAVLAEPAHLTVASSPWMEVYLDGKDLGQTPVVGASISAGSHGMKLVNAPLGISRKMALDVAEGETKKISFHLEKGKVRFIVRPWANVTLDGKPLGATPMPDQEIFEGKHQVLLSNPKLGKNATRTVQVSAGETAEVKVNLASE